MGKFLCFVDAVKKTLTVGGRERRQSHSSDARLNVLRVQVEIPLVRARPVLRFDARKVHGFDVLLQGHRAVDLLAVVQRFEDFIGQRSHASQSSETVVEVGESSADLFAVLSVAKMPCAVSLEDLALLHRYLLVVI